MNYCVSSTPLKDFYETWYVALLQILLCAGFIRFSLL
jgi:hypothetical protein